MVGLERYVDPVRGEPVPERIVEVVVSGAHHDRRWQASERGGRHLVLLGSPMVGDVAGHDDQVELFVSAEMFEHGLERLEGVVPVPALRLETWLEEVGVG
jgi:hypothetical protein